jgi:ribosomal protein S18 acetylase RimI-like enzyme
MEFISPVVGKLKQPDVSLHIFNEFYDLIPLRKMIHRTIEICYPAYYEETIIRHIRDRHGNLDIIKRARSGQTFIYSFENKIIGTGSIVHSEINSVFVDPAYQNRGIGKSLMNLLINYAQENNNQVLTLFSPPGAVHFHEKFGFQVLKEETTYIEDFFPFHFFKMAQIL